MAQLWRLAAQLATGGGNAAAALRQLQGAAWSPFRVRSCGPALT